MYIASLLIMLMGETMMFHTLQNQLQNNTYVYLYVESPPRLKAILGTSDPVMTVIWQDRLYHTISEDRHILYRVFVLPTSQDDMVLHLHDCFFGTKKPCVGSVSPLPSLALPPLFVIAAYPRTICILAIHTVWACHAAILLALLSFESLLPLELSVFMVTNGGMMRWWMPWSTHHPCHRFQARVYHQDTL